LQQPAALRGDGLAHLGHAAHRVRHPVVVGERGVDEGEARAHQVFGGQAGGEHLAEDLGRLVLQGAGERADVDRLAEVEPLPGEVAGEAARVAIEQARGLGANDLRV